MANKGICGRGRGKRKSSVYDDGREKSKNRFQQEVVEESVAEEVNEKVEGVTKRISTKRGRLPLTR